MRLTGVVFIVISAASVGFRISSLLRKKCRLIEQLLGSLQIMKNEILCCCTPLPQTFALMAVGVKDAAEKLFSSVAREMDNNRWLSPYAAMEQSIRMVPEIEGDTVLSEIMLDLASGIGKYDREAQIQIMDRTIIRLEDALSMALKECSVRSKTYEVLGICTGISVAILLI